MNLQAVMKAEFETAKAAVSANYEELMKQQAQDNDAKMSLYAKQRDEQIAALNDRYGFEEELVTIEPTVVNPVTPAMPDRKI